MSSGIHALVTHAPEAARALAALEAAMWREMDRAGLLDRADLAARVCADLHGLVPLARPAEHGASPWRADAGADWRALAGLAEADRALLRFAEQFSVDVASITEAERADFARHLGAKSALFAQALYPIDFVPRARFALDALFGASHGSSPAPVASPADEPASLWAAIEAFLRCVPRLDRLDPVTTELVRLRGARQHQCRICKSLRSRSALAAGADDATFDAIDRYETSDLSDAHKTALAFTDALVWSPGRLDPTLLGALRERFTDAQCVELVLDVTRNAANKFPVSLAVDAARVDDGYEIYDIDPDGNPVYGLDRP